MDPLIHSIDPFRQHVRDKQLKPAEVNATTAVETALIDCHEHPRITWRTSYLQNFVRVDGRLYTRAHERVHVYCHEQGAVLRLTYDDRARQHE